MGVGGELTALVGRAGAARSACKGLGNAEPWLTKISLVAAYAERPGW